MDSAPGRRDNVETTIAAGHIVRRVTGSMLARHKHAVTTTRVDLVRPVLLAMADRGAHLVPATIVEMLPMTAGRADATTISADAVQASSPTGRHAIVMTVTVSGDSRPAGRSGATTRDRRRAEARVKAGRVVTDQPAHHVAARGPAGRVVRARDPAGHRAVRVRVLVGRDRVNHATTTGLQVEQEVAVSDRRMTIAIDGPAAAGKSTVGEIVAQKIEGVYFDTGLLYRALTLLAIDNDIAPDDETRLADLAATMDIQIGRPSIDDGRQADVLLNGRDVTHSLRTPAIDRNVSAVSAHAAVRAALLEQQRRIGRSGRVVMVGRDIGTVVLPDAELKVFLDASPEERARRRCLQLGEMGRPMPYDAILADMIRRDRIDSERDVAPLKPAPDAVIIDSDRLSIEEVAAVIVDQVNQRSGTVR
jgi:cytidylate kinase